MIFNIIDNGIGIPAINLVLLFGWVIFNRFYYGQSIKESAKSFSLVFVLGLIAVSTYAHFFVWNK